jgi:hypothetical protein
LRPASSAPGRIRRRDARMRHTGIAGFA